MRVQGSRLQGLLTVQMMLWLRSIAKQLLQGSSSAAHSSPSSSSSSSSRG
jgi:hypothetical protein